MNPIKNVSDLPLSNHGYGEGFAAKIGQFAPHIGLEKLGCRLVIVPAGKKAWPFHNHHLNEEMFVILEGTGTLPNIPTATSSSSCPAARPAATRAGVCCNSLAERIARSIIGTANNIANRPRQLGTPLANHRE